MVEDAQAQLAEPLRDVLDFVRELRDGTFVRIRSRKGLEKDMTTEEIKRQRIARDIASSDELLAHFCDPVKR